MSTKSFSFRTEIYFWSLLHVKCSLRQIMVINRTNPIVLPNLKSSSLTRAPLKMNLLCQAAPVCLYTYQQNVSRGFNIYAYPLQSCLFPLADLIQPRNPKDLSNYGFPLLIWPFTLSHCLTHRFVKVFSKANGLYLSWYYLTIAYFLGLGSRYIQPFHAMRRILDPNCSMLKLLALWFTHTHFLHHSTQPLPTNKIILSFYSSNTGCACDQH